MKQSTSLVFTGDIGFDHYMDHKWEDKELLSPSVRSFLSNCDHLVINVEGALSEGEKQVAPNGVTKLMHSMNPAVADFFNDIGADIWSIANNHIMDAGPIGMADTLRIAAQNNVKTIGAGMNISEASKPIYLDEAGGIGMFAVGYQRGCKKALEDYPGSFSWSDMDRIRDIIQEIKKTCRWCIIVAHGGEEFTALPTCYTRQRYMDYLEMGADIVVSHHPHVPMNYETVGDKIIFYSLGNFIFDTDYQRSQFNTEKGLFIRLDLTEEDFTFTPFGITINRSNEHIEEGPLPLIFEDVQPSEYKLLEPLAAKMFLEATKRQQRYMNPEKFKNATESDWYANFYEEKRSGRVPGEALDFQIIYPIAQKESEKAWEKSKLENVKKYILEQM